MTRADLETILDALRIGADLLSDRREDQESGVDEGLYEDDPEIDAGLERNDTTISRAIGLVRIALAANGGVPDPWHVGELSGDNGLRIRDENGLLVCTAPSREAAELLVGEHNGAQPQRDKAAEAEAAGYRVRCVRLDDDGTRNGHGFVRPGEFGPVHVPADGTSEADAWSAAWDDWNGGAK